jgi:hypothetical protein
MASDNFRQQLDGSICRLRSCVKLRVRRNEDRLMALGESQVETVLQWMNELQSQLDRRNHNFFVLYQREHPLLDRTLPQMTGGTRFFGRDLAKADFPGDGRSNFDSDQTWRGKLGRTP